MIFAEIEVLLGPDWARIRVRVRERQPERIQALEAPLYGVIRSSAVVVEERFAVEFPSAEKVGIADTGGGLRRGVG